MDMQHKAEMSKIQAAEAVHKQRIFSVEGVQKIVQSEQTHKQKLQQMKAEKSVKGPANKKTK